MQGTTALLGLSMDTGSLRSRLHECSILEDHKVASKDRKRTLRFRGYWGNGFARNTFSAKARHGLFEPEASDGFALRHCLLPGTTGSTSGLGGTRR